MSQTVKMATSILLARAEASCVTATPDKNGYVPPDSCNAFYAYYPSFGAASLASALFALATISHIILAIHHKKGFCWVVTMGTLWEFLSFGIRTISTRHQQNKSLATQSFVLFALAPLWINAFVYMVAGRLIFCFHPTKRVFKFKAVIIGRLFIIADILCFIVQLGGALLISPGASYKTKQTGLRIYQAGLGLQQSFVLLFLAILVGFHLAMQKLERNGWRDEHHRRWWVMTWILYFVLLMITLRIAYRLAEFIIPMEGNPLLNHEVYMYILDALPMFLATLALIFVHPGTVLTGPGSNYREGKKQMKAEAKAAKKAKKAAKGWGNEEEERMMGIELQPPGEGLAWSPRFPTAYSPLDNSQAHGVVENQPTLYDPHRGRM